MTADVYAIKINVGLLDKLAAKNRPAQPTPTPMLPHKAFGERQRAPSALAQEQGSLAAAEAELQQLYNRSKQVGDLLLKNEEEELQKLGETAFKLVSKYKKSVKVKPCQEEESACTDCFKAHGSGALLACKEHLDAYLRCSGKARAP